MLYLYEKKGLEAMDSKRKLRVAVIYGGRSGEHEVSLQSAASVIRNLDPNRFEVIPVSIDKQGRWLLNDITLIEKAGKSLPVYKDAPPVMLSTQPQAGPHGNGALVSLNPSKGTQGLDVVFPVMHGPLYEDGSIQGLLELADVAYVGSGVLASAVGMDKSVAKRLARDAGVPIVPFVLARLEAWKKDPASIRETVARELGFPVFVKPSNMGSSVGVHKVKEASELQAALNDAFQYDAKILVERAIDAREIEVSVLENPTLGEAPLVSIPGEIEPKHEFYSYEAKYLDENGAALLIPARLSAEQTLTVQRLARDAFLALECEGMARADFFLDRKDGSIYFNEVNTIPGFTHISMYPKMWEASGIPYRDLLSRLVDLAIARQERKSKLSREYKP
jgi:D-alanine-D-alanine ligase